MYDATPEELMQRLIRQHTSAYVSIRQHTSAYVSDTAYNNSLSPHTSAYVVYDATPEELMQRLILLVYETLSY